MYDLTSQTALRGWRAMATVVDIAWGTFSCGVASWVIGTLTRATRA